jgi:hypothetical protein
MLEETGALVKGKDTKWPPMGNKGAANASTTTLVAKTPTDRTRDPLIKSGVLAA